MTLALVKRGPTVEPDAVITGAEIRRLGGARGGSVPDFDGMRPRIEAAPPQVRGIQPTERRCDMRATYGVGEDQIPPGTFHGEDKIPPGTFH